ncbi:MAG: hypothetical protein JW828_00345 [Sedimentisphaerales bacterium]|nr:hypothetical protein [Sedimentisphaerales bacterium]
MVNNPNNIDGPNTARQRISSNEIPGKSKYPLAGLLFILVSLVMGILSFLGFLAGFVFRLPLMVVRLPFVAQSGIVVSIVLSAMAVLLMSIAFVLIGRHKGKKPWALAILVFGLNLLIFGGSLLLSLNYELRQQLASCLCGSTSRTAFQAYPVEGGPEISPPVMKRVRSILLHRLDPGADGWVKIMAEDSGRISIHQGGYGSDSREGLAALATARGILEFRILPLHTDEDFGQEQIQNYVDQLSRLGPADTKDMKYLWKKLHSSQDFRAPDAITGEYAQEQYVLTSNQPGETLLYSYDADSWGIHNARVDVDYAGNACVTFSFDKAGAESFFTLTKDNLHRSLAILIDDDVMTAPRIESAIGGSGQITGRFTIAEADELSRVLKFSPLPVALRLSEDSSTSRQSQE